MTFSAFIEAPFVKTVVTASAHRSGSVAYQSLGDPPINMNFMRQGISIRRASNTKRNIEPNPVDMFGSMFPKMDYPEQFTPNGEDKSTVFGQPKHFNPDVPFDDIPQFFASAFINYDADDKYAMYPIILGSVAEIDPHTMDGAIEPLDIRDVVTLSSIDAPDAAHRISGDLMAGDSDINDASSQIVQIYDFRTPSEVVPFIDYPAYFGQGDDFRYFTRLPGVISTDMAKIFPFRDAPMRARVFDGLEGGGISSLMNGDLAMMGSAEAMLGENQVSAQAGFVYDNNPLGTDSLAFGGLKK